MLITRSGFNAFNEYDLWAVLETQLKKLREEVEMYIRSNRGDEIPALAEKHKITPLKFDAKGLTTMPRRAKIPAEYFPRIFDTEPGQKYDADILAFHLPFTGDKTLLRCVPSARILWTEGIALENGEIVFELIKFSDDSEAISKEKDKVINFLNEQSNNVNGQVEQYNSSIDRIIKETEEQTYTHLSKQDEFIARLGVPLKKNNSSISKSETSSKEPPSRVIEKKTQIFDVFICHASEDKEYVDKLANALTENSITVWYGAIQIGWGDDLRPVIDNGLKNSRFGLVIFSKAFLSMKKWTEYELNGLFSKEKKGQKVILPIWHNITREDVSQYSLTFADRIAKSSDDNESIVKELKMLLKGG